MAGWEAPRRRGACVTADGPSRPRDDGGATALPASDDREGRGGSSPGDPGARLFDPSSQHRIASDLLLLYLGAECAQRCAFCALKTYQPPRDGGAGELAVLLAHARAARERGIEQVQLEGIDPVAFSHTLPLVEALSALGFSQLTVMGTARRFADPAFREAFLARAPDRTTVVVPVYGVTADVHDAVTGRPGSFLEARAAIDGLLRHRVRVVLTTVPTPHNVSEIASIFAFGAQLGVEVWGRLPYPLREAGTAIYGAVALRESDIVDAVARALASATWPAAPVARAFSQMVAHPCVLHRAAERPGGAPLRPRHDDRWRLEGADSPAYGEREAPIATVPCPHVATCELAARCPGRHYRAYAERFGLEEFTPPVRRAPARFASLDGLRDTFRRWAARWRPPPGA